MKNTLVSFPFLALVLFGLEVLAKSSSKTPFHLRPECNVTNQERVELEVARLFGTGPYGRPNPETPQEVEPYCLESLKLMESIQSYIQSCYRRESQNMINLLLFSIKSVTRQMCKKDSKLMAQLMPIMPCYNKYLRPDDECLMQFVNETKQLIPLKDNDAKISHTCCNYVKALKCQEAKLDQYECLREHKEFMLDYVRRMAQDMNEVMCGEYNEYTDKCDNIGPQPKPAKPNTKKYKNVLLVLMENIDSLTQKKP